jgi:hypothetical protein
MTTRTLPLLLLLAAAAVPSPASAADALCDPAFQDCRTPILNLIRNEQVGIDVAFWFMEDARYSAELIKRAQAGVPVRILVDPRANAEYPINADRLNELQAAGIPMRKRIASGILHWKMMLFSGQNTVQFSGANYSPWAFVPVTPYLNYTDEAIYFSSEASIVNSFRTKYDSLWINTTSYANYANITGPLTRRYEIYPQDPELNFPPEQSFRSRSVSAYNAETTGIDVIMFRITDRNHTDAIIAARQRGVPVRLLTDDAQYRTVSRYWHAWNVDRLYMAGVQVRVNAHQGVNHQKTTILKGQRKTIFGSSNWTGPSSDSQQEHNYFTVKPYFFDWFTDQFDRKWNNETGNAETKAFTPLPPGKPTNLSPANTIGSVATTGVILKWHGDYWSHKYDVYFGTASDPPLVAANLELGASTPTTQKVYALPALQAGTTYFWRIVSKTMADRTNAGPVWTFTTAGGAPPPPPPGTGDIVLHVTQGATLAGTARRVSDSTAASGSRVEIPDAGASKVTTAAASPANYYELTFNATAGVAYHLWVRGKAASNYWGNDSAHIQFSGSVTSSGAATWRIGTTSSTEVNLEDCSGCGISGWGWQDNGWGIGVMGPHVRFAQSGTQRIRIQTREDGFSIDQIVLSPSAYLSQSPGALKNDTSILTPSDGGGTPPPPPPPPPPDDEVVLYAGNASTFTGGFAPAPDSTAAGGRRMAGVNSGAPKVVTASASPGSFFEMSFFAESGTPYRLWMRGKAEDDYWGNDSVHVQFSGSVTASGAPVYRVGTTSSTAVNLEDCSGCGISGWGWQDNGWGTGVMGPLLYFEETGTQRLRVQVREDGFSIDQIVLSPSQFLNSSPGRLKNDGTILVDDGGGS